MRGRWKVQKIAQGGKEAESPFLVLFALVLVGGLVYGNTVRIPWYLDDFVNIVDNPAIRDLGTTFRSLFSSGRGLPNLSFALNYAVSGFAVGHFHLVNITLHLLTSFLVFLLLQRVFVSKWPALAGSLVFLLHPLQTQAVNYIVQRMTLLAAGFFLLSLYLYVRWRESSTSGADGKVQGRTVFLGGALIAGGLAFLSKQNAVVLPVAWLLFDCFFLVKEGKRPPLPWRQLLWTALPLLALAAFIAYRDLLAPLLHGAASGPAALSEDLTGSGSVTRLRYLVTEFSVLWLYLRLLFLPYGQMLDYGYPVVDSLLAPSGLVALVGLVLLGVWAWRARASAPRLSFAIAWFFLTLAVESTLIPLDPVFEHRLYLPLFALALLAGWGVELLLSRRRLALVVTLLVTTLLALLTFQRNRLWIDPVAFWRDNVVKSDASYRAVLALADALSKKGEEEEATEVYRRYLPTLLQNKALASNPKIMLNLGVTLLRIGESAEAEKYLRQALFYNADYLLARYNLGVLLYQRGDKDGAGAEFERVLRSNPRDVDSLFNLAVLAIERRDRPRAEALVAQLQGLDGAKAAQLQQGLSALP